MAGSTPQNGLFAHRYFELTRILLYKENLIMKTKELLDTYYKGFAQKQGWEKVIADDFHFIGGDMTKPEPVVGKQAYVEIINRFSKLFTAMRVKEMYTTDSGAFVLANYDYTFPNGK